MAIKWEVGTTDPDISMTRQGVVADSYKIKDGVLTFYKHRPRSGYTLPPVEIQLFAPGYWTYAVPLEGLDD